MGKQDAVPADQLKRIATGFRHAYHNLSNPTGRWAHDQPEISGTAKHPPPFHNKETERVYRGAQTYLAKAHREARSQNVFIPPAPPIGGHLVPPGNLFHSLRGIADIWGELENPQTVKTPLDACDHTLRPFHTPTEQRRCKRRHCQALLDPFSKKRACDRCRKRRSRRKR